MSKNATEVAITAIITTGLVVSILMGLYLPEVLDAIVALFGRKPPR